MDNAKDDSYLALELFPGHEGIYRLRDLKYIIRILRKISKELKQTRDIDWAQLYIESFLLLNSRVYENLSKNLVRIIEEYNNLPKDLYKKFEKKYHSSISYQYHNRRRLYRAKAAHETNYLRVTVLDLNDVLPQPINYKQTQSLRFNVMSKDLFEMWSVDIACCSDELEKMLIDLKSELNKYATTKNNCLSYA